jgi:hypothetical protein
VFFAHLRFVVLLSEWEAYGSPMHRAYGPFAKAMHQASQTKSTQDFYASVLYLRPFSVAKGTKIFLEYKIS